MFEWWVYLVIAVLGLVAGVLGGMLGVGGSTIMIPGLVMLFGQGKAVPGLAGEFEQFNQHLYQAAAMIVNVLVAVPATLRHRQHDAVQFRVVKPMIIAAVVAMIIGVTVSNLPLFRDGWRGVSGPVMLGRVMALFLVYVIWINIRKLFRKKDQIGTEPKDSEPTITTPRCLVVGFCMGLLGGLTGIGGGAIAVPLQLVLLKLPLRICIANSLAAMCICAAVGAIYKNATLGPHGLLISDSLTIAALLGPTAMIGAYAGGRLTHVLPQNLVRVAFVLLIALAAWKMAAIGG